MSLVTGSRLARKSVSNILGRVSRSWPPLGYIGTATKSLCLQRWRRALTARDDTIAARLASTLAPVDEQRCTFVKFVDIWRGPSAAE